MACGSEEQHLSSMYQGLGPIHTEKLRHSTRWLWVPGSSPRPSAMHAHPWPGVRRPGPSSSDSHNTMGKLRQQRSYLEIASAVWLSPLGQEVRPEAYNIVSYRHLRAIEALCPSQRVSCLGLPSAPTGRGPCYPRSCQH